MNLSREIKFRGKRTDNGKWIYGFPDSTHGAVTPTRILEVGNYMENDFGMCFGHVEPIVEGTMGQYTGLKDKKDKEIYEGDIVTDGAFNYVIIFYGGAWVARLGEEEGSYHSLYPANKNREVIGNIYENPELIN